MKFMMPIKSDQKTEAGAMPDEKIIVAMGKYNEELRRQVFEAADFAPELFESDEARATREAEQAFRQRTKT